MDELNVKRFFTATRCCQISQQLNPRKTLTVCVELIPRAENKNNYDEKIQIQLKEAEVSLLLDTLMMYRAEMEVRFHGTDNDKMLLVRNQTSGLFLFMRQGKADIQYEFNLDESARYELLALVTGVLARRDGISIKDVLDLSRALASRRAQLKA